MSNFGLEKWGWRTDSALRISGFLDFAIVQNSKYKKTPFQKLDQFPSSGEGKESPTVLS
jgi:hypothetical protein